MIFNILILAAIGGIAYFHYAQGFFSATMSAVIAILAAIMAVSYHEPVVSGLLGGKMGDYANSMVLVAIFAIVYVGLRVLMDKAVPGNIRLPVVVDRVGGAAMGVIAGIFTAGVFALAGAALPFGPGVYARYPLEDRPEVNLPVMPGVNTQSTADVNEQLTKDTFDPDEHKALWIPADDLLLKTVQAMSNGGSLAGDRTLASIHPNYADELFAQRLGVQVGASHTALNLPGRTPQVDVPEPGVFRIDQDLSKSAQDAELPSLHQRPVSVKAKPSEMQLVVRVKFSQGAADSDRLVRISPASVRLCASEHNYFPVGTLEKASVLFANKVDDFLVINLQKEDRAADFVFIVDPADMVEGDAKAKSQKIKDSVFIEVKRLARVDLSGREVKAGVTPSADVQIERKPGVLKSKEKPADETSPAAQAAAPAAPFIYQSAQPNKLLFTRIATGSAQKDLRDATIASGTLSMQSGQFTKLDINTTQTLQILGRGSGATNELFEPTGMKLVQVQGAPPAEGGDPWAWGSLRNYQLVDAAGKNYTPAGAWAKVKKQQSDRMVAKYDSSGATPPDVTGTPDDGRPTDVWIAFLVPSGTHLKQLNYNGKSIGTMDKAVP